MYYFTDIQNYRNKYNTYSFTFTRIPFVLEKFVSLVALDILMFVLE